MVAKLAPFFWLKTKGVMETLKCDYYIDYAKPFHGRIKFKENGFNCYTVILVCNYVHAKAAKPY